MSNNEQKEMKDVFKEHGLKENCDDKDLSSQHKEGAVPLIQQFSTIVLTLGLTVFSLAGCSGTKLGDRPAANLLPKGAVELTRTVQERDGESYTSVKYNLPDGTPGVLIIDGKGAPIKRMPALTRSTIGPNLRELLSHPKGHKRYIAPGDSVEVVVVLNDKMMRYDGPVSVIEVEIGEKGKQSVLIDGKPSTVEAVAKLQDSAAQCSRCGTEDPPGSASGTYATPHRTERLEGQGCDSGSQRRTHLIAT